MMKATKVMKKMAAMHHEGDEEKGSNLAMKAMRVMKNEAAMKAGRMMKNEAAMKAMKAGRMMKNEAAMKAMKACTEIDTCVALGKIDDDDDDDDDDDNVWLWCFG